MKKILLPLLLLATLSGLAQDIVITDVTGSHSTARYGVMDNQIILKNTGIIDVNKYISIVMVLSIDNLYDENDPVIGFTGISSLASGSTQTVTPVFLSGNLNKLTARDYYMIIVADPSSNISETDKANNTFLLPYTITPSDVDFTLTDFTTDKTAYPVKDLIVPTYTLKNLGTVALAHQGFWTAFYLSSDAILDAADIRLGSCFSQLNNNVFTNDIRFGATVPAVSPGNYYLIANTDDDNGTHTFDETNELNNIAVQSISIVSSDLDLQLTAVDAYQFSIDRPTVMATVKNSGTTPVSEVSLRVYFVNQSGVRYDDYADLLDYTNSTLDIIKPGQSKSFALNINLGSISLPDGAYTIHVDVNPGHKVVETNYTNNSGADDFNKIYISTPKPPQFTVTDFAPSKKYNVIDVNMAFHVTVYNDGPGPGGSQLCNITIFDATSTKLYSNAFIAFIGAAGSSTILTPTVTLNNPLPQGTYTVTFNIESPLTTPSYETTDLVIGPAAYTITGTVQGEDGTPITKGNIFLYKKADDGSVAFVAKSKLTSDNTFSFPLDTHPSTLYFIPDSSVFHGYVPTVYGKTLTLKESSYFTTSDNMSVSFDILKVQPLGTGDGVINGTVSSGNSGGREKTDIQVLGGTAMSHMVVLLSGDAVVNYTYTDTNGFYEFKNLPRGQYQLYVPRPLDQTQMTAPQTVDITTTNATADFQLSQGEITARTGVLLFSQTISFDPPNKGRFGDAPIMLAASANSGLPVTLTSSNPDVAVVENEKINIKGAGTTTITAKQSGNQFYKAANDVTQTLTINKGIQTITFAQLSPRLSTDHPFDLMATSDASLPVSFTSDNETVAAISNNTLVIHSAGNATITASQAGNNNYEAASDVARVLTVNAVTGLEDVASGLTLYPNPAGDIVYMENENTVTDIELIDALGKSVKPVWQSNSIDLTGVAPGIYLIRISLHSSVNFVRVVKK